MEHCKVTISCDYSQRQLHTLSLLLLRGQCGLGAEFVRKWPFLQKGCPPMQQSCVYPTGRAFSLEFRFHYFPTGKFPNGKFAKCKFCLLLHYINLSMIVYMITIQNSLVFNSVNLTNLSQVAKLNSVYIFIQQSRHMHQQCIHVRTV